MQVIGILVLVDEDIAELLLVIGPCLLVLLEQPDRVEDNVVKIQCPSLPQLLFVSYVQTGDLFQAEVPALCTVLLKVCGHLELVLGPGDSGQHRPGRELFVVKAQLLDAVLHHPERIVSVIDGEG